MTPPLRCSLRAGDGSGRKRAASKKWPTPLDWYHLLKKCQVQLSLALTGREHRHTVLKEILPLLWHGLVAQAILSQLLRSSPDQTA